jgi:RTX calcium-binding nonapeptide repeat (4 copies)
VDGLAHLIAVVGAILIGCTFVVLGGCAGMRSEAPQEEQEQTEATKEQGRSPKATASEEGRCEGTRTLKRMRMSDAVLTTNDLPGCPKGGLLSGTDKHDNLAGEDGEDEVRGLGAGDFIFGGSGNDVIYGGPGRDNPLVGDEGDDVIYGGAGDDGVLMGDEGNDVIYGGPGNDIELHGDGDGQRDKLYCGEGRDSYMAEKVDYVSSSCEVKLRPSKSNGIP